MSTEQVEPGTSEAPVLPAPVRVLVPSQIGALGVEFYGLAIGRIVEVAGIHRQGGGGFVGLGITDQQDPEPVCQLQIVILPMVVGTGIWAHWGVTRGEFI